MVSSLLLVAALLQALAVAYGLFLLSRRQGATGAWLFLLGGMSSMLTWRLVVVTGVQPPLFFNPLIAIWGSTCMVVAMFLFGREVTLRRQAEAQRDALLESERLARAEAERASRLKDEFLATLSHELRTPLAAILGWCTVIRTVKDGRAQRDQIERAIDTIQSNARAQARLIDDLLDVTRMQAGTLQLDMATVQLTAPVRAAIQGVRPAADAKDIVIELECAEDVAVRGDADRLQQVAANLFVNAVKFTPAGGRITVTIEVRDGAAQLRITDTGEGFDAAFIPHLFTRFRQADSGMARQHGGLGLGLSIVAKLVQLHGGQVNASSPGSNRGATFTVTLPLASGEAASRLPRYTGLATELPSITRLTGVRVILVDDEDDVRTAVAAILEQLGAKVVALSSAVGIEAALANHHPQVLLLDISMPGEDGYTLMRRIRKLPASAGGATPAISLTAHARREDRERAFAAGFQQHLPKPIDVPNLAAAIAQLTIESVAAEAASRQLDAQDVEAAELQRMDSHG